MIQQYSLLNKYRIDSYLPVHRLAIEIDKKGHMDRRKTKEKEKQKEIKKDLEYKFIRINPDGEDFDMDARIATIFNHINEANKKLTEELIKKSLRRIKYSRRILGLEFESNDSIKTKSLKYIIKEILPRSIKDKIKNENLLLSLQKIALIMLAQKSNNDKCSSQRQIKMCYLQY